MPRKAAIVTLSEGDIQLLEKLRGGQKVEKRLKFRASIVLACSSGKMVGDIASCLHTKPNTVIQ